MTDPIDLLNEASWLDSEDAGESGEWLLVSLLRGHRTVGDLRRLLALARDAERLRGLLGRLVSLGWLMDSLPDDELAHDLYNYDRAALEGPDR